MVSSLIVDILLKLSVDEFDMVFFRVFSLFLALLSLSNSSFNFFGAQIDSRLLTKSDFVILKSLVAILNLDFFNSQVVKFIAIITLKIVL